mgnify:CR=1 FL=1
MLSSFLQEFQQMTRQSQSSASSLQTDRGAGGQLQGAGKAPAYQSASTGNLAYSELKKADSQASSVKFKEIEDKGERESAASNLFGQALMMAPSFD